MTSSSENMEGGMTFKQTKNDHEKIFVELCSKFIRKNSHASFRWKEINQEFESIIKQKCVDKTLKNKYDYMKKKWRM